MNKRMKKKQFVKKPSNRQLVKWYRQEVKELQEEIGEMIWDHTSIECDLEHKIEQHAAKAAFDRYKIEQLEERNKILKEELDKLKSLKSKPWYKKILC